VTKEQGIFKDYFDIKKKYKTQLKNSHGFTMQSSILAFLISNTWDANFKMEDGCQITI
jgi:hypothetical protein